MRLIDADALMAQLVRKKAPVAAIRYTEGFNDALMRFRSMIHSASSVMPTPDPITGLVPCGCGGKAEYYYHPIEDWVAVECVECGAGTSYKDTKEQARDAWNNSRGYRDL